MVNIFTIIKGLSGQICQHDVDYKEGIDEKITVVRFFWLTLEEEEKSRIQQKQDNNVLMKNIEKLSQERLSRK